KLAIFQELPLDLLPLILWQLVRPSHVANASLVNKGFYTFAIGQLYRRVFIYAWHANVKTRFVKLFRTLSNSPELARLVEELTIRDFPRTLQVSQHAENIRLCLNGIRNCVNLRTCTWTRDGSLSNEILQSLHDLPSLTGLEINGNSEMHYHPAILPAFRYLHRLCVIMPSPSVCEVLPQWFRETGTTLKKLSLICRTSPKVNDDLLKEIAPHLFNLEELHLLGCHKITHQGLLALVSSNSRGLVSLGAEALSPTFDMSEFSQQCRINGSMRRLTSITLTVGPSTGLSSWGKHVLELLSESPLEMFHISTAGGDVGRALPHDFVQHLVTIHGRRLRRFSVQRMHISVASVEDICHRCPNLSELFVVLEMDDVDDLGPPLSMTRQLRSLHINRPVEVSPDEVPVVKTEKILTLVRQCGSDLRQIGFSTRVWQVQWNVFSDEGVLSTEPTLAPYENPEVPEQFLVLR
ncbi:hypothetical protein BXZ70DRAFT_1016133, partial [Cristinia sonorae]